MSWAERIPAAIEKAEDDLARQHFIFIQGVYPRHNEYLTATEVALAQALWAWEFDLTADEDGRIPDGKLWPSPALRAFVEKVEAL